MIRRFEPKFVKYNFRTMKTIVSLLEMRLVVSRRLDNLKVILMIYLLVFQFEFLKRVSVLFRKGLNALFASFLLF